MSNAKYLRQLLDDPGDRRHGTTTGYAYGCRCERCRAAARAMQRAKRTRRATPKPRRKVNRYRTSERSAPPKDVCTVDRLRLPMMGRPSACGPRDAKGRPTRRGWCAVCGAAGRTELHHVVPRGAGKLVVGGKEVEKPVVELCGHGNADGCHGLAHQGRLHFRWAEDGGAFGAGHWEAKRTERPMAYLEALSDEEGWVRLWRP